MIMWLVVLATPSLLLVRAPTCATDARWSHASAALDAVCFPPNGLWKSSQYDDEIACERSELLGAWEGDELRGLVVTTRIVDETHLLMLLVHPESRRRSIGESLVLAALRGAWEAQQVLLTLEVRESNAAALGLYTKCGLREVGRRPRYYHGPQEDALLLTATLDRNAPPPSPLTSDGSGSREARSAMLSAVSGTTLGSL